MGQAKQRGTHEERKAFAKPKQAKPTKQDRRQALAAGAAKIAALALNRFGITPKR